MGLEDYLAVYRLTVHLRETGERIHRTASHKNITKIQAETLLGSYKNNPSCKVIKHYLVID